MQNFDWKHEQLAQSRPHSVDYTSDNLKLYGPKAMACISSFFYFFVISYILKTWNNFNPLKYSSINTQLTGIKETLNYLVIRLNILWYLHFLWLTQVLNYVYSFKGFRRGVTLSPSFKEAHNLPPKLKEIFSFDSDWISISC